MVKPLGKGTFLGYLPSTTSTIMWYDLSTNRVKIAKHARFDEEMNDLPFVDIPPNVQHLTRARYRKELEEDTSETSVDEFVFTSNLFSHTIPRTMQVCDRDSSFGFELTVSTDKLTDRAYVAEVKKKSSADKVFS